MDEEILLLSKESTDDKLQLMEKIIMKIGTAVLSEENSEDPVIYLKYRIEQILSNIIPYIDPIHQQLIVISSGAVGMGKHILRPKIPLDLQTKQICASIGQVLLMESYQKSLVRGSFHPAQVLLTSEVFSNLEMKRNLFGCLRGMEGRRLVPIVNENDVISSEELVSHPGDPEQAFSDNDQLSSLLAQEIQASLLILLTDGDGIYQKKPSTDADKPIALIETEKQLESIQTWKGSALGRGGIESKIASIRRCLRAGVPCWVTSGRDDTGIRSLFAGWETKNRPISGTFVVGKGVDW